MMSNQGMWARAAGAMKNAMDAMMAQSDAAQAAWDENMASYAMGSARRAPRASAWA